MDEQPLISVVINAYNRESYVRECMDSVVTQKVKKEIICIDDASTDRTADILDEYARRHPEVKVYRNEENQGTVRSRYRGLTLCRGKYMMFVDPDDRLLPGALKKLCREAEKMQVDILEYSIRTDGDPKFAASVKRTTGIHQQGPWEAYKYGGLNNLLFNKIISAYTYTRALTKMDMTEKQTNFSDVWYLLYGFVHNARKSASTATEGYFYYTRRGMTHNIDSVNAIREYAGAAVTAHLLEKTYGEPEVVRKVFDHVCRQAIVEFFKLSEVDRMKYRCLIDNMMTKEKADSLIEERRKCLSETAYAILQAPDGTRQLVPFRITEAQASVF